MEPLDLLLVEDDKAFVDLIIHALEPHPVRVAHSMADAMRLIREAVPDAILLDLALPDSSAHQTLAKIYDLRLHANNSPVIVITGRYDIEQLETAAVKSGAERVLNKDKGFFEALGDALLSIGNKTGIPSPPTVAKIEDEVERITRPE